MGYNPTNVGYSPYIETKRSISHTIWEIAHLDLYTGRFAMSCGLFPQSYMFLANVPHAIITIAEMQRNERVDKELARLISKLPLCWLLVLMLILFAFSPKCHSAM